MSIVMPDDRAPEIVGRRHARATALRRTVLAVLAMSVVAGACGDDVQPIEFDPTTAPTVDTTVADTTPSSAPTLSDAAQEGSWVDVTGNLVGLESDCGNLSFVAARPDRDGVIAGVAAEGLWASDNGSSEWQPLGTGRGSAEVDNRASAIVFDPATAGTFWESGTYGSGVFRTSDDGVTFTRLGDAPSADLVSIDLGDPARRTLVVGVHERSDVYRSLDGGATWQDVSAGLPAAAGYTSFPYVVDVLTYLVGTRTGSESGVYRTTDGGTTWTRVTDEGVAGAPLRSAIDGYLYWLLDRGDAMVKSVDNGATWTRIDGRGPIGGSSATLLELPDGRFASLSEDNVILSADRGVTWKVVGPALPMDPSGLAYSSTRDAFYAWKWYCDETKEKNPVVEDSILRWDVAPSDP